MGTCGGGEGGCQEQKLEILVRNHSSPVDGGEGNSTL